jgi:NADP-dependent 3-hydroxy acid dehydrogenase YdfG
MPAKIILITGASSGIGAALARAYARAGVTLLLWGRDEARLNETASQCRALGAAVTTQIFDLRDVAGFARLLDAAPPMDLAIFNAGLGGFRRFGENIRTGRQRPCGCFRRNA